MLPRDQLSELVDRLALELSKEWCGDEADWIAVAERRAAELKSGTVQGVAADEVMKRAQKRLGLL